MGCRVWGVGCMVSGIGCMLGVRCILEVSAEPCASRTRNTSSIHLLEPPPEPSAISPFWGLGVRYRGTLLTRNSPPSRATMRP